MKRLGLCLAGPTASGKTALALALAQRVPLEVISVDSALVYRGLDIGTAKPTPAERGAVPHHLIDILDPLQSYSAAAFAADAARLAAEIRQRGRLPLLVGGTSLYFKALREGLDTLPAADAATRAELELEAARHGWPALHAELARIDPITAARLAPADAQRVQRALEVYRLSGRPLSAWHQQATPPPASTLSAWPMVSLEPISRALLHARIAERVDRMLAQGLVDEVQALRTRGDLHPGLPAMRCVGYRQVWAALDRADSTGLRETLVAATRQLAKRQLTWLRKTPQRTVQACDTDLARTEAVHLLERLAAEALTPGGDRGA